MGKFYRHVACDACRLPMLNFSLAGPDLIRWDLEVVETNGFHRICLKVQHTHGLIVEYFKNTQAVLLREQELEDLLITALGFGGAASAFVTQ